MTTVKRLFILLFVLLGYTAGAWAIEQDSDGYYLIGSVQDWKDFAAVVETTQNVNAKMIADIDLGDVQTMIGTSSSQFKGIFDGQGYTLTVHLIDELLDGVSPFRAIDGATIKNLAVGGSVTGGIHTSGLVGGISENSSNTLISNVMVSATITTTGTHCGGILGHGGSTTTTIMKDCLFNGTINGKSGNSTVGAIWGWHTYGRANITSCLENGTYTNNSPFDPIFKTYSGGATVTNSYYVNGSSAYGTQATATMLTDGSVVEGLNNGRTGDDAPWVQDPLTNQPMLKIFATLKQDADGYYLIGSVTDWRRFAELVNSGTNPAANARMVRDVDLGDDQTRIGSISDNNSAQHYKGIFDGQGHKLTIAYVETGGSNLCAPFNKLDGATIKNLHIKGTINTAGIHGAGVASDARGITLIQNVWSEVDVTSTHSGWDECSGIVGCMKAGSLTITDCLFSGTVTANSSYNGGFIGYKDSGTASISNCLSTGTFAYGSSQDFSRGATVSNSYYTQFVGSVSGLTLVTDNQLADGTIATALQADREEEIWVQDPELGIPMLKIFANTGEEIPVIDPNSISGLVQHWPFDGNANNTIPGGVDATVYGATLTTDRFGNDNSAYYFDGNDKMIAAGAANFGTTSFTANIWVCSTKTSGLGNLMRTDGGYYKGWLLRFNSGRIEIWEGRSFYTGYVSTTSYADGNWHMVTFVRDVENMVGQLYVDGCYIGGYSMGSPINDVTNELRFGTYGDGEFYTGKMDDARLYNRALSAEEIAALYTQNGAIIYTVPASGVGTFSAAYNIIIPEELTAYYCTTLKTYEDGNLGIKVSKLNGGIIPANTGVLIEGPASQSYTLTTTNEEAAAPAGNSLVAVVESQHIAATEGDYTNFMMSGGKFIRIADESEDVKMPANRAYLPLLTADISGSNAKEIMLLWDDKEATGIESLTPSTSSKGEGSIYNLNGQKLSSPLKGINIINGRKVIVK